MSRALTAGAIAATIATAVKPILLAELDFSSGFVRCWTGVGTLSWGGHYWLGVGTFGGVSAPEEASDLRATSITFSMSGIPNTLLASVLGENYRGRSAKLWWAFLDASNGIVADPFLVFGGRMDTVAIVQGGESASVAVTAESRLVDLERARIRRFNDQDQQQLYPGDLGFQFIAPIQNVTLVWGQKVVAGAAGGTVLTTGNGAPVAQN